MTCFGVLSIGLVACSANAPSATAGSTPTDTAKVKTAIESANARFLDAFKRGDKATMIANYVDDAVLMRIEVSDLENFLDLLLPRRIEHVQ